MLSGTSSDVTAALAESEGRTARFPQIRFSWQARKTRSGWSICFTLPRVFRLFEANIVVNIPDRPLRDGQSGVGYVRFFIDRSQEDPPPPGNEG